MDMAPSSEVEEGRSEDAQEIVKMKQGESNVENSFTLSSLEYLKLDYILTS